MKHLLLIDLSHLWWAAWHATADAEVGEAFHRTLQGVDKLLSSEPYDHCAICCDAAPYWRSQVNPAYKANRQAAPPMALEQFRRVREALEKRGELLWRVQGYEADDIIAHASRIAVERGMTVTIATNDKDLLQLVSDRVSVVSTATGAVIDPAAVLEKMGVAPEFVAQLLALTGDKGDNVAGIPGVGIKKAAALIHQFGDAPAAIKAALDGDESITPALRKALAENWQLYDPALEQIALTRDVPGLDFESLFAERTPTKTEPTGELGGKPMGEKEMGKTMGTTEEQPQPERPKPPPEKRDAIVAVSDDWNLALEPRSTDTAWKMAQALMQSRMYGNLKNEEAVFAIILRGRALGLDATTALSSFHVIEGRPAMHADLIVALVMRSPACEYFECSESTATQATYITKRRKGVAQQTETFTIQDAYRAGLVVASNAQDAQDGFIGTGKDGPTAKSNWSKYRKAMLRHRAATQLARRAYPDLVLGLYTPDEVSNGDVFEAEFEER